MVACMEAESTSYLRQIIGVLLIQGTKQKRVINISSAISGASVYFGGWILPPGGSFFERAIYLSCCALLSYLFIIASIIVAGAVVNSSRINILAWPQDQICADDISEILDRLACLFVPITLSIAAVFAFAVSVLRTFYSG